MERSDAQASLAYAEPSTVILLQLWDLLEVFRWSLWEGRGDDSGTLAEVSVGRKLLNRSRREKDASAVSKIVKPSLESLGLYAFRES